MEERKQKAVEIVPPGFIESLVIRYGVANIGKKACDEIQKALRPRLIEFYEGRSVQDEPLRSGRLLIEVKEMKRTSFSKRGFLDYLTSNHLYERAVNEGCLYYSESGESRISVRLAVARSRGAGSTLAGLSELPAEATQGMEKWGLDRTAELFHRARLSKKAFTAEEESLKKVMSDIRLDRIVQVLELGAPVGGCFTANLSWDDGFKGSTPDRVNRKLVGQIFGDEVLRQFTSAPSVSRVLYVETDDERYFRELAIQKQMEEAKASGDSIYDLVSGDGPEIF